MTQETMANHELRQAIEYAVERLDYIRKRWIEDPSAYVKVEPFKAVRKAEVDGSVQLWETWRDHLSELLAEERRRARGPIADAVPGNAGRCPYFTGTPPSWDYAPAWAMWLAQDGDGEFYWFEREPTLNASCRGDVWNLDEKDRCGSERVELSIDGPENPHSDKAIERRAV